MSVGDSVCDTGETASVDGNNVPECTLRAAIQEANANETGKRIVFDVPGGNLPIIAPESPLPSLTGGVDIDGSTQPITSAATTDGNEAFVQIEGLNAGDASGLVMEGLGNRVRGLAIADFDANGILINGGSGNRIQGNIIGTDHSGTPMPNNETGIKIFDSGPPYTFWLSQEYAGGSAGAATLLQRQSAGATSAGYVASSPEAPAGQSGATFLWSAPDRQMLASGGARTAADACTASKGASAILFVAAPAPEAAGAVESTVFKITLQTQEIEAFTTSDATLSVMSNAASTIIQRVAEQTTSAP